MGAKSKMDYGSYTRFVEEYRRLAEAVGMGALRGKWMLYGLWGPGGDVVEAKTYKWAI